MDECNIIADAEDITSAQECRRKFVEEGGVLVCAEATGCVTPTACAAETSTDAQCFLTCDAACASEVANEAADEDNECAHMCASECGRLLELRTASEEGEDGAEEGEQAFTASDVAQCVQLCSVASECLAKDQMYEFNAESLARSPRLVLAGAELANPVDETDWQFASSAARKRIVEALQEPESPEAAAYEKYIGGLHALDGRGRRGGGGIGLPEGMSASDLLSAMGMEGAEGLEGLGEADLMAMLEQMMGGGGMGGVMGGGDEYGGMYGGDEYGSGDPYESMLGGMGGMGGMGGGESEYEVEEEADDFE